MTEDFLNVQAIHKNRQMLQVRELSRNMLGEAKEKVLQIMARTPVIHHGYQEL